MSALASNHVANVILGKMRPSETSPYAGWPLPITTEAEVAFAIKAATTRPVPGFDIVVDALEDIGRRGDWITREDLVLLATRTGAPIAYLEASVRALGEWLADLRGYLRSIGVRSAAGFPTHHGVALQGGQTTAAVLAGDDVTLAPWVIAHLLLAGSRAVVKGSSAEPLSAYRFVTALAARGITAPSLLYLRSDEAAARSSVFRLARWARRVVVFGEDETLCALASAVDFAPHQTLVPYWTGRSGAIVLADADVARAAADIVLGATMDRGNKCVSTKKVFVVASVADAFLEALVARAASVRTGAPTDAATELGTTPLADVGYAPRIGADHDLLLDRPVRIVRCRPNASVLGLEPPFPMLAVRVVDSEEDAIREANESVVSTPAGRALAMSVFTKEEASFERCADQLLATKVLHDTPSSFFDFRTAHQGVHLMLALMQSQERVRRASTSFVAESGRTS